MKQDPITNFVDILRKISMIVTTKELSGKRDFKKYLIELFDKRVINNPKTTSNTLKIELNKILTFSKEEMNIFKEVEFDFTTTDQFLSPGELTYEKFHFFIEEKFKNLPPY